jgi:hypothetical protein
MTRWLGHKVTGQARPCRAMLADAFRYLLMSSTEKYLDHAIDRSDFERRLRVVQRQM